MYYAHHCGSEGSNLRRWIPRSAALEGAIDAAEPDLARGPSSELMVPLNFAPETSHGSPLRLGNLIVMAETRLFHFRVIADDL
jgi:hypothetical protein